MRKKKETFYNSFELKKYIPEKYIIPICLLVMFLLMTFFFREIIFFDKVYRSGDYFAIKSHIPYLMSGEDPDASVLKT